VVPPAVFDDFNAFAVFEKARENAMEYAVIPGNDDDVTWRRHSSRRGRSQLGESGEPCSSRVFQRLVRKRLLEQTTFALIDEFPLPDSAFRHTAHTEG